MSQLERLAQAVVQVGKQSGPVMQSVSRTEQAANRVATAVPNDEAGYSRTIRTQLYEGIAALRDVERLLTDFDKQADAFAKRLVGDSSAEAAMGAATAGADPGQGADGTRISGTSTPSGREFLEETQENEWLKAEIAAMPSQPGEFTATLHGNPDEVAIDGHLADALELADAIRADPNWNGQPVLLLSCRTGARSDGIAQQLASLLRVPVRAPTGPASFAGHPPHPVTGTFLRTPIGRLIVPNHHFVTFMP